MKSKVIPWESFKRFAIILWEEVERLSKVIEEKTDMVRTGYKITKVDAKKNEIVVTLTFRCRRLEETDGPIYHIKDGNLEFR